MAKRKIYQVVQVYDYKGQPNREHVCFESTRMKDIDKWLKEEADPTTPSRYYKVTETKKEVTK